MIQKSWSVASLLGLAVACSGSPFTSGDPADGGEGGVEAGTGGAAQENSGGSKSQAMGGSSDVRLVVLPICWALCPGNLEPEDVAPQG